MFGRTVFGASSVFPTRVSSDGSPKYKAGGITIDWANSVSSSGTDTTLPDGSLVKANVKFLRYGQVMCAKSGGEADTVTIGGGASGGTFTVTMVNGAGTSFTTAAVAFGASAATLQTALLLASTVAGAGQVTVTGTGAAATAEVNTVTWTSPTVSDVVTIAVPNLAPVQFTVNATATATSTTTQAKEAWNGRADLAALGTATGTTTFIVTGATAGKSLGLTVSQQGTGTAANVITGNASPYTITFSPALGPITVTGDKTSLTGGTPTLTVAQTVNGSFAGWYGPYDPTAVDGRASLVRGSCFILDETVLQYGAGSLHSVSNDNIGSVFDAGDVFIDRVLQSGTAGHSLTLGPTLAEFLAAFPAVQLTQN